MAKTEKKPFQYNDEKKLLHSEGPLGLYMLRGEEDFLRDRFLEELTALCVEEGSETFNYHRIQGPELDLSELTGAVDAMPFMGERTLTEIRGVDINALKGEEAEALKTLLSDLPEWATVVFVFAPGYKPDSRLGVVKTIKKLGREIEFSTPPGNQLTRWVMNQAESCGKSIGADAANHLLWVCGTRMNTLVPEILKIAGVTEGAEITRREIDAVAKKIPETTIFDLTNALGAREYDKAAGLLADLLADRDEPPQKQIVMVSEQFRRLYVARVALDERLGDDYIGECIPELAGRSYPIRMLRESARRFSRERLARAVRLCADCDYGMKSNGPEPAELMKELVVKLAMDKNA